MEIKYPDVHAWFFHYTLFVCSFGVEGINKVRYVCGRPWPTPVCAPRYTASGRSIFGAVLSSSRTVTSKNDVNFVECKYTQASLSQLHSRVSSFSLNLNHISVRFSAVGTSLYVWVSRVNVIFISHLCLVFSISAHLTLFDFCHPNNFWWSQLVKNHFM
jgi:hypothetical protein